MSLNKILVRNILTRRPGFLFVSKNVPRVFSTTVYDVPVLRLFSKSEGCSLCDNAKEELMKFHHMFVYEEIDITAEGNETWYELYKYDIPVIHINNREVMRHYVDEPVLLEALEIASGRKV